VKVALNSAGSITPALTMHPQVSADALKPEAPLLAQIMPGLIFFRSVIFFNRARLAGRPASSRLTNKKSVFQMPARKSSFVSVYKRKMAGEQWFGRFGKISPREGQWIKSFA